MKTIQIHLTIDVPQEFGNLLKAKADELGLSVSEFVKKILAKEVKEEKHTAKQVIANLEGQLYPVKTMSKRSERRLKKALEEKDKAVDASTFFCHVS
ncbi:MAG: hypothetical protein AAB553_04335 [Patescibacteria group bacterium]